MELQFPLAGLHRALSRQTQPPYTTPDCLNVIPDEQIEGRARGGSRPGMRQILVNFPAAPIAVNQYGVPAMVTAKAQSRYQYFRERFLTSDYVDGWTGKVLAEPWASGTLPTYIEEGVVGVTRGTSDTNVSLVGPALDLVTTTLDYAVSVYLIPSNNLIWHGDAYLFLHLSDTGNVATGTLRLHLQTPATGTTGHLWLARWDGTQWAGVWNQAITLYGIPTWLTAVVTGTHAGVNLKVRIDHGSTPEITVGGTFAVATTNRFGIGLRATRPGGPLRLGGVQVPYVSPRGQERFSERLLVATNGRVYHEKMSGGYGSVATDQFPLTATISGTSIGTRAIFTAYQPAAWQGRVLQLLFWNKLYPLDNNGKYPNWSELGVTPATHEVAVFNVLYDNTTPSWVWPLGRYPITALTDTMITLGGTPPTGAADNCERHMLAAVTPKTKQGIDVPLLVDVATDTPTVTQMWPAPFTADKRGGGVPFGCGLAAAYNDRLVLARDHVWYMSRAGDIWDFDFSQEDAAAAIGGSLANVGQIGSPITALAPFGDDYLVFGCLNELWVLKGDPGAGGVMSNLSRTVGIVGQNAWCITPTGEMVFLSTDGVYVLPSGAGAYPQSLSRDKLPRELMSVDRSRVRVCMAYDVQRRGIWLYLTPDTEQGRHWFIAWPAGTFWPIRFALSNYDPIAALRFNSPFWGEIMVTNNRTGSLLSPRRVPRDMDYGFTSHVVIGPLLLGGESATAIINELTAELPELSTPIQWELLAGDTLEGALAAPAVESGTFGPGYSYTARPRRRARVFYLRLSGVGDNAIWTMERIYGRAQKGGRLRKV